MLRSVIYVTVGLFILVNIASDYFLYKDSELAKETSRQIPLSQQNLDSVYRLREALFDARHADMSRCSLGREFEDLKTQLELSGDGTELTSELVTQCSQVSRTEDIDKLIQTTDRLIMAETRKISNLGREDGLANSGVSHKLLFLNSLDIFMVLIFMSLFFYERRRATTLNHTLGITLLNFEKANSQLREIAQRNESKIKRIVHDLKNPLGTISGFAELVASDPANRHSVIEATQVIQRVSNTTLSLVTSLLSELHENQSTQCVVELNSVLREVQLLLSPLAIKKGQSIEFKSSESVGLVRADPLKLRDVIMNILSNAIKFSPRFSSIRMSSRSHRGQLIVEIQDEGPGFSKEDLQKVFLPHAELSAKPTGGESSTGLGLYSAKTSLDEMGGRIRIESEYGKGATVILEIPEYSSSLPFVSAERKKLEFEHQASL
ncbi:MAG: HAMP domain-containing histidine kinase [Bdellovibrionales bacterium]|nr:HAMP domain-containing histidine kinase [Bdellovibrionales bacterium]